MTEIARVTGRPCKVSKFGMSNYHLWHLMAEFRTQCPFFYFGSWGLNHITAIGVQIDTGTYKFMHDRLSLKGCVRGHMTSTNFQKQLITPPKSMRQRLSYNGRLIWDHLRPIKGHQYQWPQVILCITATGIWNEPQMPDPRSMYTDGRVQAKQQHQRLQDGQTVPSASHIWPLLLTLSVAAQEECDAE